MLGPGVQTPCLTTVGEMELRCGSVPLDTPTMTSLQFSKKAQEFTEITHNHPEGIKGGQATAVGDYLVRMGKSKSEIKDFIETRFQYDLNQHVDEITPIL